MSMHSSSRRFWVTLFSVIALASLILAIASTIKRGIVDLPLMIAFLIVVLVCLIRVVRDGVDLTAEGIVIRKFGTRIILWSDISKIDTRNTAGMRQARVHENGRTRNLPVPSDRWPLREKHFDEKFEMLKRHWKTHR